MISADGRQGAWRWDSSTLSVKGCDRSENTLLMLKWLLAKATSHLSHKVQMPGPSPSARRAVLGLEPEQSQVSLTSSTSCPFGYQSPLSPGFPSDITAGSLAQKSHLVPMAPFSERELLTSQSRTQQKSSQLSHDRLSAGLS